MTFHLQIPALIALYGVVFSATALAQEQTPTLPTGPLILKRAPAHIKWEIQIRNQATAAETGKNDGAKNTATNKITVIKTPGLTYEETVSMGHIVSRRWHRGETNILLLDEAGPFIAIQASSRPPELAGKFHSGDFEGFEWISPKTFRGIKKLPQGEFLEFIDEVPPSSASSAEPVALPEQAPVSTTALVDATTRLPVLWKRGDEARIYRFSQVDQAPPFPEQVQQLFKINETAQPPGRALRP